MRTSSGSGCSTESNPGKGVVPAFGMRLWAAAGDVDYIAFIDDDELPEPGWLKGLHDARQRFGADVVAGAVITDFPPDTSLAAAQRSDELRAAKARYGCLDDVVRDQ